MVFRVLNRLIGRTDSSDIAINAYVDGNASADETRMVETMMQSDPALERDLQTQIALKNALDHLGGIEAPRSFAITPEMVAQAERSESGLSKMSDLFAPQKKLALAPAVVAGIAALSVALLTIGDVAGLVEQSRQGSDDSGTAAFAISKSAGGADGATMDAAAPAAMSGASDDSAEMMMDSVAPESGRAAEPPTDTASVAGKSAADSDDIQTESAIQMIPEAEAEAPAMAGAAGVETAEDGDDSNFAAEIEFDEIPEEVTTSELPSAELAFDPDQEFVAGSDTDDAVALPLRELQLALAAIAVLAVLIWAGLRRIRD